MSERHDLFWAEFFGIAAADLRTPGLSVVSHVGLAGFRGVWFFLRGSRFATHWAASRFRVVTTRANGQLALAFYRRTDRDYRPSSLQLVRFVEGRVAEMMSFIGPGYLRGFEVPDHLPLA